jgi:hypothetical protein
MYPKVEFEIAAWAASKPLNWRLNTVPVNGPGSNCQKEQGALEQRKSNVKGVVYSSRELYHHAKRVTGAENPLAGLETSWGCSFSTGTRILLQHLSRR